MKPEISKEQLMKLTNKASSVKTHATQVMTSMSMYMEELVLISVEKNQH
jgi:hypothetical protein